MQESCLFDTRTNREVALVRAGDPRRDPNQNDPFDVVSGDGQLKIAASNSTVPQPESLAAGAGAVWVLNQQGTTVTRIDAHTNKVAATIDLSRYPGKRGGGSGHDIVATDGSVWAIARSETLVRINPLTNRIVAALSLKQTVDGLAVGDGAAWVGSPYGSSGFTEIIRVDLRAMQGT